MRPLTLALLGLAILAVASAWLAPTGLDRRLLDLQFSLLRQHATVDVASDPVIVGIDDQTYLGLREPFALWHSHFGRFYAAMAEVKPSVLAVDIVMPAQSYDYVMPGNDRALLLGLRKLRREAQVPLVLAQSLLADGSLKRMFAPIVAIAGQDSFAAIALRPDRDGVVRRVGPFLQGSEGVLPVLSSEAAHKLGYTPQDGWINYRLGQPFDYIPFQQVLAWHERGELAQHAARFTGRPVLLGPIEPFTDRHPVPVQLEAAGVSSLAQAVASHPRIPGVMIHAQILRSYLADAVVRPAPVWALALLHLAALSGLLLARGWLRRASLLVVPALLFGAGLLLLERCLFLPLGTAIGLYVGAVLLRMGHEQWLSFRERFRLRQAFGAAVSPAVLKGILAGQIVPERSGRETELCVLFADLRGFTRRCQTIAPTEAVQILNGYFESMVAAIHAQDGTVDKFIGDGILAFFGEPRLPGSPNPCVQAARAIAGMDAALVELNRRLEAQGVPPLRVGGGLHYGPALVGFVGSAQRREYTVIGDTVNTASRMESLNKKIFGERSPRFSCVISQDVWLNLAPEQQALYGAQGTQILDGGREVRSYGYASDD